MNDPLQRKQTVCNRTQHTRPLYNTANDMFCCTHQSRHIHVTTAAASQTVSGLPESDMMILLLGCSVDTMNITVVSTAGARGCTTAGHMTRMVDFNIS